MLVGKEEYGNIPGSLRRQVDVVLISTDLLSLPEAR